MTRKLIIAVELDLYIGGSADDYDDGIGDSSVC